MKKLFTILTVVAISTTMTFAQQGSVAIGVGSNLADVSWQDYSLTPTVGYFISDNMMVGTGFAMGSSSQEENDVKYEDGGMNISPFFRFYMNDAFFASAGIAIGSSSSTGDATAANGGITVTIEDKTSTFGLNAGVGYSLMWNDRICIEPSFGIATGSGSSSSKTNIGGTVTETDSDAPSTFGMAIGLGINIRLGGE